jgi:hypothetical protein
MTTKPDPLQVLDHALGDDLRHDLIGVVDALWPGRCPQLIARIPLPNRADAVPYLQDCALRRRTTRRIASVEALVRCLVDEDHPPFKPALLPPRVAAVHNKAPVPSRRQVTG